MASPGWYNENAGRAFPFLAGSVGSPATAAVGTMAGLPNSVIVDAGFTFGLLAGYAAGDKVWLNKITRSGDTFTFEFGSDASVQPLVFTRWVFDTLYTVEYVDVDSSSSSSETSSCGNEPVWFGYLVTGDMAALDAFMPEDGVIERDADAIIEPALIQNLASSYMSSVNLANDARTYIAAPNGCPELTTPTDSIFVSAECLTANVYLKSGYNTVIRRDLGQNALIISASAGGGEGYPCDEVPLYSSESLFAGSQLYEGGPTCNEVLRAINGVSGPTFNFIAEDGVVITPLTDLNTVLLNANMSQLAICYAPVIHESETLP